MFEHKFESSSEAPTGPQGEAALEVVFAWVDSLDCRARLKVTERIRRRLVAGDARALAATVVGDPHAKGSTRTAFRMAAEAGVSKAEQRRRVNRARAVADNGHIADQLAAGALGVDHVDAVAAAARRSDGAAAKDPQLLAELE